MSLKTSIAVCVAATTIAVAPFSTIQHPASAASTSASASSVSPRAARYTVTVKCQLVRIDPYTVVGYIYGTGSGPNYQTALNNAKRDADNSVPQGHYKRHCYAIN